MLIRIQAQHNMRFLYRDNVEEAFVSGVLYYRKERIVIALSWFCLLYTTQNNGCNYWKTSRQIGSRRNGNIAVSFTMPTFISRFNVCLLHLNLKLGWLCSMQLLICFSISIKYQNVFAESLIKYIQALLGKLLTI